MHFIDLTHKKTHTYLVNVSDIACIVEVKAPKVQNPSEEVSIMLNKEGTVIYLKGNPDGLICDQTIPEIKELMEKSAPIPVYNVRKTLEGNK